MALSRSESSRRRFYSMSAQIRRERDDYYAALERMQRGATDVSRQGHESILEDPADRAPFAGCLGADEAMP